MKRKYLLGALVGAALSLGSMAYGAQQDFTLVNHTGMSLSAMYVAPESDENSWGSDLFEGKVLPDGNEVDIVFSPQNQECDYAINFKDAAGTEWEIRHVDLCYGTWTKLNLTMEGGKVIWAKE